MSWEALRWDILGAPLLAGLLVLSTHVPLGRQVLARGIIFMDLAVAQVAGLGVIGAHLVWHEADPIWVQLSAYGSALAAALLLHGLERRYQAVQEALIGSVFVLAASSGVLLLAGNPQAGEHLQELLVGQILWVDMASLAPTAALYALVLAIWFLGGAERRPLLFYLMFAVAVTASVQLVGVYLVFASLILPALATLGPAWRPLLPGYLVGGLGYALGLVCAALFDLPAGAVIVWCLAIVAIGTALSARWVGRFRRAGTATH